MTRPTKLDNAAVESWLTAHASWKLAGSAIVSDFAFEDFATALAFAVRVGCAAEKRDHHPEMEMGWGRVKVTWSTHDAGGVTSLDLELAEITTRLGQPLVR